MKIFGIFDFDLEKDGGSLMNLLRRLRIKRIRDKQNTTILFVDDEEFPVIDNLRNSGWLVVKVSDISNIDSDEVKRAEVIFIDNRGVGKILAKNDAGIGLAKIIKKTYGNKKRVVLYSGHRVSVGENLNFIDSYLDKDADTYQFDLRIREELSKL